MKKVIKLLILAFFFLLPFNVFGLEEEKVKLYLFYGDGCPHCADEKVFHYCPASCNGLSGSFECPEGRSQDKCPLLGYNNTEYRL